MSSSLRTPPGSHSSRAVADLDVGELNSLALRGLAQMFDDEKQLFCYRLVRTDRGLVREGLSPRYTIMTLLGLRELERSGSRSSFGLQLLYESFISNTNWVRAAGDLGLLIWLSAAVAPDDVDRWTRRFDLHATLDHYSDTRVGRTMELAWLLTGLASASETSSKVTATLTDLALKTYWRLRENQGESGLFGHMNTRKSLAGRLRGRIGSFADQIYPVYAISKFAKAFQVEDALSSAMDCARAICRKQGNLGQWWWLYDSRSGRVASRYPVYSVHQHGMAPMGLFAIEEATGQSFQEPLYKGLSWIYGSNELGVDMRDCTHNLIWRSMLPTNKRIKYWETALSVVRPSRASAPVGQLGILYEDRPYELGWLLFAFAKRSLSVSRPCRASTLG